MFKIRNIKNRVKRIFAVFLAIIICFSCCIPALALTSSIADWNGHHRITVNKQDAFCINYGIASSGEFKNDDAAVYPADV